MGLGILHISDEMMVDAKSMIEAVCTIEKEYKDPPGGGTGIRYLLVESRLLPFANFWEGDSIPHYHLIVEDDYKQSSREIRFKAHK